MVQEKICRGADIYISISIRICMYIALQSVRYLVSKPWGAGSLDEAGRVELWPV